VSGPDAMGIDIMSAREPATVAGDGNTVDLRVLGDCDGYRAISPDGYVGTVDAVLYGAESRPAALAIRRGLFSQEIVIVAIEDVYEISPERRILVLGALSSRKAGTGD
jgi:hypothetical protein